MMTTDFSSEVDVAAVRRAALVVLREGRCRIIHAAARPGTSDVTTVIGVVTSSRPGGRRYAVDYIHGAWDCTCGRPNPCPHIAAVQLVTVAEPQTRT